MAADARDRLANIKTLLGRLRQEAANISLTSDNDEALSQYHALQKYLTLAHNAVSVVLWVLDGQPPVRTPPKGVKI